MRKGKGIIPLIEGISIGANKSKREFLGLQINKVIL